MRKLEEIKNQVFFWSVVATVAVIVLSGPLLLVILLGWQAFVWLRYGEWHSISFSDSLSFVGIPLDAIIPSDWTGLAVIVRWFLDLHAGIAVTIISLVIYILLHWYAAD